MSKMSLTKKRIDIDVVLEGPGDDILDSALPDDESRAEMARELGVADKGVDLDMAMGLGLSAFARLVVMGDNDDCETAVVMTRDELVRHVYECRCVLRGMDAMVLGAEGEWKKYMSVRRARNAASESRAAAMDPGRD